MFWRYKVFCLQKIAILFQELIQGLRYDQLTTFHKFIGRGTNDNMTTVGSVIRTCCCWTLTEHAYGLFREEKGMVGSVGRGKEGRVEAMRRLCSSAQYTKEFEHAAPGSQNDASHSITMTCTQFYIYFVSKYFHPSVYIMTTISILWRFKFDRSKFHSSSCFSCTYSYTFKHTLITNYSCAIIIAHSANSNNYIGSDIDARETFNDLSAQLRIYDRKLRPASGWRIGYLR